jgi:hypothetical protein
MAVGKNCVVTGVFVPRVFTWRVLTPRILVRAIFAAAGFLAISFCGGVARGDEGCKALYDALTKVVVTPTHIYTTTVAGYNKNVPRNSEMIYAGGPNGAIYVLSAGKWTRAQMTSAEMTSKQEENRRTAKDVCHAVREEMVNGEAATVYSTHSDNDGSKIDATVWISKSKGLPLKEEMDMDVGGGAGKTHISMRYEYANVKPPAV